jgi:hypothetical protein
MSYFFGYSLNPRAACYEAIFYAAFRALCFYSRNIAAMVAFKPFAGFVHNHPAGARFASNPMSACRAEHHGRIAPSVKKKHCLITKAKFSGYRILELAR